MAEVGRKHIGLALLLASTVTAVGISIVSSTRSTPPKVITPYVPTVKTNPAVVPTKPIVSEPASVEAEKIVVHVAGAVKSPGVYELKPGDRNNDAIKAAGGPLKSASIDGINLAAKIEDGSQLYVPTVKEHPEGGATDATTSTPPKSIAHAGTSHPGSNKITDPKSGKINLNKATAEELQRLPGIGPAMAERILEYRKTSGGFKAVEELREVTGIGEKKFAKLEPFVKVK